ncbi:hypothetical protein [Nitrococcus mobilis]|uniref:hypothetical protein n=1 Tax=Nitrococcus mobilis TaxID=35797 RepID=UPI00058E5B0E|nr:hypothetical protein [Nitrococcus mobilis]
MSIVIAIVPGGPADTAKASTLSALAGVRVRRTDQSLASGRDPGSGKRDKFNPSTRLAAIGSRVSARISAQVYDLPHCECRLPPVG